MDTRQHMGRGARQHGEANLAWTVVEAVRAQLDPRTRGAVFLKLGAGEHIDAIGLVLWAVTNSGRRLPPDVVSQLESWLDCYVGHPAEPGLRRMLRHWPEARR